MRAYTCSVFNCLVAVKIRPWQVLSTERFQGGTGKMKTQRFVVALALALLMLAGTSSAQTVEVTEVTPRGQVIVAKRQTLAVRYKDNDGTSVNMVGTTINPQAMGKAEVQRKEGRSRIRLEMENLGNTQALGAYYTTYILWA